MAKKTVAIASSGAFETIERQLLAAYQRWSKANAEYTRARMQFDIARLANAKVETSLFLTFSQAKAAVKEATDAYYQVVSAVGSLKQQVNIAKAYDKLQQAIEDYSQQVKRIQR